MKKNILNGVPAGPLNCSEIELLDDKTLQSYAKHYAIYGAGSEEDYLALLCEIVAIYKTQSASELLDLFRKSIPFPSYPWFHIENLTSYLNFAAQYYQLKHEARLKTRPNIPFFAFPKTGSSYVTNTLANALDIPFGVTSIDSRTAVPAWSKFFADGPGVLHDHLWMDEENAQTLEDGKFKRIILHVRDPRQVIISTAHHAKISPDTAQIFGGVNISEVSSLSPEEIIQHIIDRGRFIGAFSRWFDAWQATGDRFEIFVSQYELMNSDPQKFFREILQFCDASLSSLSDVEKFLYQETNESKGKNFNFRSGDSEEWKHVLTDKQKDDIRKQMTGSSSLEIYPD
tara:strand:- start:1276 stop:2304 length:1029 start_codon:yes stop_codon:yes gene_type:complete